VYLSHTARIHNKEQIAFLQAQAEELSTENTRLRDVILNMNTQFDELAQQNRALLLQQMARKASNHPSYAGANISGLLAGAPNPAGVESSPSRGYKGSVIMLS